ncbi:MAG: MFS transporter [Alphaproteobacteria bacterium]
MSELAAKAGITARGRNFWGAAFIAILCGSGILFMSFGIRHGFGLFQQPISDFHGWNREHFSFAIATQNLVWGAMVPFVGMIADRYGAVIVVMISSLFYAAGLWLMASADHILMFNIGAGALIGIGLSGTTFPVIFGTLSRLVAPEKRSLAMGITMALASFGQFAFMPIELALISAFEWKNALIILSIIALFMIPLGLGLREKSLRAKDMPEKQQDQPDLSIPQAIMQAAKIRDFWLVGFGFFTCGFQVVFIGIHLPPYLSDNGFALSVSTTALGLIGLFNIIGTYYAGKWGGVCCKPKLLAWLYLARSVVIILFLLMPLSLWSVYFLSITIGLLWLSTVPLTNGTIASIFGVKHLSMLGGFVFFVHQLGSFAGVWMGGYLYDLTGNYDAAWMVMIALGLVACAINWPVKETPVGLRLSKTT